MWNLVVLFVPQIVFIIMGIKETLDDVQDHRQKMQQLEKEREEQERREELGRWK